jgi:hypothetical protein
MVGRDLAAAIILVPFLSSPLIMTFSWYLYKVFLDNIKRAFSEPLDIDPEDSYELSASYVFTDGLVSEKDISDTIS